MTAQDKGYDIYRRAKAKYDNLQEDASLYFENNKDLVAASEFESAMALGCFDQEFMYFATAYQDEQGVAYRISAKEIRLHQFVEQAATLGLYPTPVKRYIKRTPCPSGYESKIRQSVKIQAAQALRDIYNAAYFQALRSLSTTEPNNSAYPLLAQWQEELDGVYDHEQLALYQGLLLTALESKVLTVKSYLTLDGWLQGVYKELEDDIIAKGLYKKVLSGFAYALPAGDWHYFYDAKIEVTYNEKAAKEQQGYQTTPIFVRERWLKDMSQFRQMRQQFAGDYQAYCTQGYLARLQAIKNLPSPISPPDFHRQLALVQTNCSPEAAQVFASYRYKWNVLG